LDFAGAVFGEANAGKLPTRRGGKEVAIGDPAVSFRRYARTATQHVLVDHEFAVVFADSALRPAVSRIGRVAAARPLPRIAKYLLQTGARGCARMQMPGDGRIGSNRVPLRRMFPLR